MSPWVRLGLLLLGSAALALFLTTADLEGLQRAVVGADRRALALAFALVAADVAVKALRWQVMAGQLSGRRLRFGSAGLAILAGVAAASLSPARSIELAKPMLLRGTHGVALSSTTAAVLVERMLDGAALIVLFGTSLVLLPAARASRFHPVLLAIGIFFVAVAILLAAPENLLGVVLGAVTRFPLPARARARLAGIVRTFAQGVMSWRQGRQLWFLLALSVIAAMLEVIRVTVVFGALGISLRPAEAMLTFSAANLVGVITLIPGGVGATELSMAGIASLMTGGTTRSVVTASVLLDRLLSYYLIVVLGSVVLLLAPRGIHADARERGPSIRPPKEDESKGNGGIRA